MNRQTNNADLKSEDDLRSVGARVSYQGTNINQSLNNDTNPHPDAKAAKAAVPNKHQAFWTTAAGIGGGRPKNVKVMITPQLMSESSGGRLTSGSKRKRSSSGQMESVTSNLDKEYSGTSRSEEYARSSPAGGLEETRRVAAARLDRIEAREARMENHLTTIIENSSKLIRLVKSALEGSEAREIKSNKQFDALIALLQD